MLARRLAEILLEDVAFVLLSRIENILQDDPDDGRWAEAIEVCLQSSPYTEESELSFTERTASSRNLLRAVFL